MVTPNFNVNLSASTFIFLGGMALSYFSHVGWWTLAGLLYLFSAQKLGWVTIISFSLSLVCLFLGIWRSGWVF